MVTDMWQQDGQRAVDPASLAVYWSHVDTAVHVLTDNYPAVKVLIKILTLSPILVSPPPASVSVFFFSHPHLILSLIFKCRFISVCHSLLPVFFVFLFFLLSLFLLLFFPFSAAFFCVFLAVWPSMSPCLSLWLIPCISFSLSYPDFKKILPPEWVEHRQRTTSCFGTLLFLGESCSKSNSALLSLLCHCDCDAQRAPPNPPTLLQYLNICDCSLIVAQNSQENQHVENQQVFDGGTGWDALLGLELMDQRRGGRKKRTDKEQTKSGFFFFRFVISLGTQFEVQLQGE